MQLRLVETQFLHQIEQSRHRDRARGGPPVPSGKNRSNELYVYGI